jgi:hypothetical protein
MRTPSQGAMQLFLGMDVPRGSTGDLRRDVAYGHGLLVDIVGRDLGFDPLAWHEHLCTSNAGGYRWRDSHLDYPDLIREAQANARWRAVIDELQARKPSGGAAAG